MPSWPSRSPQWESMPICEGTQHGMHMRQQGDGGGRGGKRQEPIGLEVFQNQAVVQSVHLRFCFVLLKPQDSRLLWARLNAEIFSLTHTGVSAALYMFYWHSSHPKIQSNPTMHVYAFCSIAVPAQPVHGKAWPQVGRCQVPWPPWQKLG